MELGLHNPVKIKSTQSEGTIKIVEYSGSTPTHFYVELLTNHTHPDVRRFKTSHLGDWKLVRVPVEDVVYREPYSSRCIYKMIDAQDLNSIKTLKDSSLTKKPTNNSQKEWGTPLNYAMIHGTADIVIYLLEKGLRFTTFGRGRSTDAKSIFDLLLCSGKIRSYDDIEKVWDKMVELNIHVSLSHDSLVWGTMGYHGQWNDSSGQIAKTNILNNKTNLFRSSNKEQKTSCYNNKKPVISLDSLIPGTFNLQISRKYDLFGMNKLGYTERPGAPTFNEQLDNIAQNISYELFDDDIHTGGTINFAKNLLKKRNIKVSGVSTLNLTTCDDNEILDARDFIFGLRNAGLVIELPNGKTSRVPYIYPFVDPSSRCSIDDPLEFSIEMWRMNKEYWINFSDTLLDRQFLIPLHNGILAEDCETKISDICEYYEKYLTGLKRGMINFGFN